MSESQNVTLSTLVTTVAEQTGITKTLATDVSKVLIQAIVDAVVAGETVRISGFATIEAVETAARTARNPSTGEALAVPASKRVSVKVAAPFKRAVKETVTV